MAGLSIDFAFEGFRVIRARPSLIAIWGIVILALEAALFGGIYYLARPHFAEIQQIFSSTSPDPKAMLGFMEAVIPAYLVLLFGALLVGAIFRCAVYRAVLDERNVGVGYLRIGGDELRQVGVMLLFVILVIVAEIVVVGACVAVAAGMTAAGAKGAAFAIFVPVGIAVVIAAIWAGVRLSLFSVQTFDRRRIDLFGSWPLTKGHVWTLIGGYLVAGVMTMIVAMIASLVIQIVVGLVTGNMMPGGMSPFTTTQPKDIAAVFAVLTTPAFLLTQALNALIVSPLTMAMSLAPSAAAYKALAGKTPGEASKVF